MECRPEGTNGGFRSPRGYGTGLAHLGVKIGDLNSDGRLDLVVVTFAWSVIVELNHDPPAPGPGPTFAAR
jgi:hypothetical protein